MLYGLAKDWVAYSLGSYGARFCSFTSGLLSLPTDWWPARVLGSLGSVGFVASFGLRGLAASFRLNRPFYLLVTFCSKFLFEL